MNNEQLRREAVASGRRIAVFECDAKAVGGSIPEGKAEFQLVFMCKPTEGDARPVQLVVCLPKEHRMDLGLMIMSLAGEKVYANVTFPGPACYVCGKETHRASTSRPDGKTKAHAKCEPKPAKKGSKS